MKRLILVMTILICLIVTIRTIRVGLELRMLHIYHDEQGLHHLYFIEPRAGEAPTLLGEEIFKDGQKVFDSYKEND